MRRQRHSPFFMILPKEVLTDLGAAALDRAGASAGAERPTHDLQAKSLSAQGAIDCDARHGEPVSDRLVHHGIALAAASTHVESQEVGLVLHGEAEELLFSFSVDAARQALADPGTDILGNKYEKLPEWRLRGYEVCARSEQDAALGVRVSRSATSIRRAPRVIQTSSTETTGTRTIWSARRWSGDAEKRSIRTCTSCRRPSRNKPIVLAHGGRRARWGRLERGSPRLSSISDPPTSCSCQGESRP